MLKYVGNALSEICNLGMNLKRLANVPVIYCLIASHLRITSIISFAHDSSIWAWLKKTSLPLQHQWDKRPLVLEESTSIVTTHTRASWYSVSWDLSWGVDQWPWVLSSWASIQHVGFSAYSLLTWWLRHSRASLPNILDPRGWPRNQCGLISAIFHWSSSHRTHLQFRVETDPYLSMGGIAKCLEPALIYHRKIWMDKVEYKIYTRWGAQKLIVLTNNDDKSWDPLSNIYVPVTIKFAL